MANKTIVKRQQKEKELLIENLKQVPIVQVAASKSGVSRATYYRFKQQDKEFAKLADEALQEGITFVNDMAESQIISAIKDGNLTSAFYWLNNRHAAYKNKVELSTAHPAEEESLNTEQKARVKKVLSLTGIKKEKNDNQA